MTTATNQSKADAGIGTERLLHMYKQMCRSVCSRSR